MDEQQGVGVNAKGESVNIYRIRSNNTKSGANKMVVTLNEHYRSPNCTTTRRERERERETTEPR